MIFKNYIYKINLYVCVCMSRVMCVRDSNRLYFEFARYTVILLER